jgi:hypothetical protein
MQRLKAVSTAPIGARAVPARSGLDGDNNEFIDKHSSLCGCCGRGPSALRGSVRILPTQTILD